MSAAAFTDQERICTVHSELGPNVLMLNHFSGTEAISRPFRFDLQLFSEQDGIEFEKVVGTKLTVETQLPDGQTRYFNGVVARFAQGGADRRFVIYEATLVPWLWLLTRTTDCRIFQQKSLPDIILEVFKDFSGIADYRFELTGEHLPWEYCVQYRESDFNFVSRLMEQEGIFYFFEHDRGKHVMVVADAPSVHAPCPGQPDADYNSEGAARRAGEISAWHFERELLPGKAALKDYQFKDPKDRLLAETKTVDAIGKKFGFEVYDYTGEYESTAEGQGLVALRLESEEVAYHAIRGRSDLVAFCPGYRFKLRNHYRPSFNEEYLLTEVQHDIDVGPGYQRGSAIYQNDFRCIPFRIPFRPLRQTPKPLVQGLQTAVVVGPAGEEIYTDQYGRVKVQFFWDRYGRFDENSSCWIRVSQAWAGKMWGGACHPRIGQEVIVEFLEGDPDRPMIIGRVYNGELMPPYELPRHQTISTLQSRSSKGGVADNFNEIRFEDEIGHEQVFVHAEMDMDQRVKQDYRSIVLQDRHRIVERHERDKVGGNRHVEVVGQQREKIGAMHLQVDQDVQEKVGQNWACETGMEIHLKAGMKVVIEAGMQVHLKVGGNHIDISPAGITIQGTMVRINSGPSPGQGSGARPELPE